MTTIHQLKKSLTDELQTNILPFWMLKMADPVRGGFYGRIDGNDTLHADAPRGAILNARILWTFASAYRITKNPAYLATAQRAKDYLCQFFIDREHGGVYWSVNADGSPADTKKQIYAIAFTIYALSEYHRACTDPAALQQAQELFRIIEQHSYDKELGGYFEAYSRDWVLLDDLRLSDKDANEKKTMNTHLHVLEAYTNLYRVWKDESLRQQLRKLIQVFTSHIVNAKTGHQQLFFAEDWTVKSTAVSYGHDIEASWLLYEAVTVLGDAAVLEQVKGTSIHLANAALQGLQADGSLIYEFDPATGHRDTERHWWVQAEAVVGLVYAWKLTSQQHYLDKALHNWHYIQQHLIDTKEGEWHWSVSAEGEINRKEDKAGFWKCPYHNGRMCMEVMEVE